MLKFITLMAVTLGASASSLPAQDAGSNCQENVLIERGDSISAIAQRCDVSEAHLLKANPNLEGSSDLVIGHRISTRLDETSTPSRLWSDFKGAVGETSNALEDVAKGINSSAQDILAKNPDLRSKIESLGSRLDISATPLEIHVTAEGLTATEEADIKVTATGLPGNEELEINVGAVGSASENVARARTGADGTLTETIKLPEWLAAGERVVITITDDQQTVLGRSISSTLPRS